MTIDIQRWYKHCLRQLAIDPEADPKKAESACDLLCLFVEKQDWLKLCILESSWWDSQQVALAHSSNDEWESIDHIQSTDKTEFTISDKKPDLIISSFSVQYGKRLSSDFLIFFSSLSYPIEIISPALTFDLVDDEGLDFPPAFCKSQLSVIYDFECGLYDYERYYEAVDRGDFCVSSPVDDVSLAYGSENLLIRSHPGGQHEWKLWLQHQLQADKRNGVPIDASNVYMERLKEELKADFNRKGADKIFREVRLQPFTSRTTMSQLVISYVKNTTSAPGTVEPTGFNNAYNALKKELGLKK